MKPPITCDEVLSVLRYDRTSGTFSRDRGRRSVGTVSSYGYLIITINRTHYLAHRLAWLICYGRHAEGNIDHINGNRLDNRVANLRLANHAENAANCSGHRDSKTGVKGVVRARDGKRFLAFICKHGRRMYLGTFNTADEASAAYRETAAQLSGEFARAS